ncbi:2,3-bisphosphoglycerate-independent phosphoglycerate mutase [Hypsibius exemplaris]|uniref:phosphoglycerate mutase (2,3-diphosphoglycerate-independent) n=1 Tax=Hypsibius exemplaris TaxID=2072580 RepID=A0A1W0WCT9_HYPEX|nr:2,3-bisphosphoglycerate-independent phosphoglycerate mutase [Hypsibius exemplaris]
MNCCGGGMTKKLAEAPKVCLIVIDGWGLSEEKNGNAIFGAKTPVMDDLSKDKDRFVPLEASGLAVGLPRGLMGNSEVGHLNIGAGRVVYQDIVRINLDVENNRIDKNLEFVKACERAKNANGRMHLAGMVSDGGVHSHIDHLFSLLLACKQNEVPKTLIQCFADGRDTSPTSAIGYLKQLQRYIDKIGYGEIATVTGRYYAMDRDKRWERIKIAFDGMYKGVGEVVENPQEVFDVDGDTIIFFDFRSDRMREIVETFGIKQSFETDAQPRDLYIACMTQFNQDWKFPLLYPPINTENTLPEWISNKNLTQFHCAETEKYAHVTFFFNGGKEKQVTGEERCLVESPKVATYDLQPEMSCEGVADKMIEAINLEKYNFVMCNFAPPDMVGHTGVYEAAVRAVEATDVVIGRVYEACKKHGYVLLVTADHGNAEQMLDEMGKPHTAHTTNNVPFIMANTKRKFCTKNIKRPPALCDVAPTVLDLLCQDRPAEMGGQSLMEGQKV